MDALQKIRAGDPSRRIYTNEKGVDINITSQYELSNVDKATAVTRGPVNRPGFDKTFNLDSSQIKDLANWVYMQAMPKQISKNVRFGNDRRGGINL